MVAALAQWLALGVAGMVLGRSIPIASGRRGLALLGGLLLALFLSSWALFVLNQFLGLTVTVTAQLVVAAAIAAGGLVLTPRKFEALPPAGPPLGRLELALVAASISAFVITSAELLLRPWGDLDGWMYHFPLARELLGGAFPSRIGRSALGSFESAYPPHLYYLYALGVRGSPITSWPAVAKWMHLGLHAAACAYLWALARDRFGLSRVAALVVLLFGALRFPIGVDNDEVLALQLASVIYLLAALYHGWDAWLGAVDQSRAAAPWGGALLAGGYWGNLAVLPFAAFFLAGAALERAREKQLRAGLQALLVAGGIVLAVAAPHWIRNALAVGNPVYPAFTGLLGGRDLTAWYHAHRSPISRQVLPSLASLHRPFSLGLLAVLPLATLACLFVGRAPRRLFFAVLIGGYTVVWLAAMQQYGVLTWRYLWPLWAVMLLAIASSAESLEPGRRAAPLVVVLAFVPFSEWLASGTPELRAFVLSLAALSALAVAARAAIARWALPFDALLTGGVVALLFAALVASALQIQPWVPLGLAALFVVLLPANASFFVQLPPSRFSAAVMLAAFGLLALELNLDPRRVRSVIDDPIMHHDIGWLNGNLAQSDRVLMWEAFVLPIGVPWLAADSLEAEPALAAESDDAALAALRVQGITHVWFSRRFVWSAFDEAFRARVERFSERVYQRGEAAIFRLPTPPSSTPRPRRARWESRPRGWSSPSR